MKFTLDQIRSLDAIEQQGSFSAAAIVLNKAQSAVSYDIRQMEARLGIRLFDRKGHRSVLTPEGRTVLDEGRFLLARARRIETMAEHFHSGWESRLEIVIDGILPMEPIMKILKKLGDENVPTKIQVKVEFLGGVQHRFEKDRADMMLVKEFSPDKYLEASPLPEVTCVLVVSSDHPLAHCEDAVSLPGLQEHIELTVHDSSESEHIRDNRIFGGARVYYLSDFYTKHQAVRLGLGFGWMPYYLVAEDLKEGRLYEVPYEAGSRYSFAPYLVHPVNRPLGRTGRRFLKLLHMDIDPARSNLGSSAKT